MKIKYLSDATSHAKNIIISWVNSLYNMNKKSSKDKRETSENEKRTRALRRDSAVEGVEGEGSRLGQPMEHLEGLVQGRRLVLGVAGAEAMPHPGVGICSASAVVAVPVAGRDVADALGGATLVRVIDAAAAAAHASPAWKNPVA